MRDPSPTADSNTVVTLPPKRSRKRLLGVLVGLGAAAAIATLVAPPGLGAEIRAHANTAFDACRAAGPLPFFGAMALLPVFGFPLSPFTVTAGPLFGPTMGGGAVIACAALAVAINVALSYWISARLLRPTITRLVTWMGYRLPEISERSAWITTLIVRIVPGPPFFLQSYLLGLMRVRFSIYLLISTLVPLGYIACLVLFGDAIARRDPMAAVGAGALLLVVGTLIHVVRRRLTPKA
ncbi:TVP38/TMEM64 family protein [Synoicihabitans lomoniglobus]|uniref:TVP38/TMEM64 family membrane protein n=1 Tax=Synoicihabitans lomoniglobus TaxID=2909285 RepID=A0AAE9ZWG9_9BACT|nr:VTT domain-containing protein [Opitutaceae bacterium LMO-M01]WED64464.1 VTT domain-containing protein [Opitutaceae bacterium LMO-M01]